MWAWEGEGAVLTRETREGGQVEKGHPGKGVQCVREAGWARGTSAGRGPGGLGSGSVGGGPGGPGSGSAKRARAFAAAIRPVPIETPPFFSRWLGVSELSGLLRKG